MLNSYNSSTNFKLQNQLTLIYKPINSKLQEYSFSHFLKTVFFQNLHSPIKILNWTYIRNLIIFKCLGVTFHIKLQIINLFIKIKYLLYMYWKIKSMIF